MELEQERQVLEAPLPWTLVNFARLAVYLVVASVATSIVFGSGGMRSDHRDLNEVFDWLVIYFFTGGLACLPGTILWLIIVARLSPELSSRKRRLIAAAIAPPLIGLLLLMAFGEARGWLLALIYGVLFPAGSAVVFRPRGFWRRSRVEDAY
jgi:hypothetical protein